jgi:O-antigen/teichoic acid export membrane protein
MKARSFSGAVGWALAGNAAYAISQWAITVALAKLASPVVVGEFALALALTNPLIVLSLLQLRGVILTQAGKTFPFQTYLLLRVTLSAAAFLIAVIFAIGGDGQGGLVWTVAGVGAWKALDAVCDIYFGRWQAHGQMDRVSKALAINGGVSILAVGVAVLLTGTALGAAAGSAIGSVATLVYVLSRATPAEAVAHPITKHRLRDVLELARLAAPLGVVMAIMSLQVNVPRYFIQQELGAAELGIFAAANQLTLAGGNIITAFAAAASPRLVRCIESRDGEAFQSMLFRLVLFGLALGAGGALLSAFAGGPILAALYRPDYARAASVLVWLSVAAGFTYAGSFLGYGMTIAGAMRSQTPLFVIVLLCTALGCLVLVPRFGVSGAAMSMGFGALIQVLGSMVIVRRALRVQARVHPDAVSSTPGG